MIDRRVDKPSRQRIVNLEDRYRRVTKWLVISQVVIAGTLVVSIAGMVGLFTRQQESRVRVLRIICETTNRDHQAIRAFVIARRPRDRRSVERTFPVIRDCRSYAERQVAVERRGVF